MTDYNFAKNYENIKNWEFKSQIISDSKSDNYLDQFLEILKKYPNLLKLLKTQKILYFPTLFIFAGVGIIEIFSIFPTINIKRLELAHFEYEEKVNALNEINRDREDKFNILKDHSSLLSNPAPTYLFGFYLQESIPKNVQLLDYLVDKAGFKLNAVSNDLVTTNKFISLLRENKLIDKESIKINRIINRVNNSEESMQDQSVSIDSISMEISGKITHLPLRERIESHKSSSNFGSFKKLSTYLELLDLIR